MKKIFFSFFASILFLTIAIPSANAEKLSSLDENIIIIELTNLEELDNQDLVVPLAGPIKPNQENFGGIAGGLNVMSGSAANTFVRQHGYKDVHHFKKDYLGEKAPIAQYNLYYSKGSTRYVYILNSSSIGVKATEIY